MVLYSICSEIDRWVDTVLWCLEGAFFCFGYWMHFQHQLTEGPLNLYFRSNICQCVNRCFYSSFNSSACLYSVTLQCAFIPIKLWKPWQQTLPRFSSKLPQCQLGELHHHPLPEGWRRISLQSTCIRQEICLNSIFSLQ